MMTLQRLQKLFQKSLKKFKKSNLQIDNNFYIEAKCNIQKLIKEKKIEFFNRKLTDKIGEPKELWMSLKPLGLASIKSPLTDICLKTKYDVTNFDDQKNANIFKKCFCSLADDLLGNLPLPFSKFSLHSVR